MKHKDITSTVMSKVASYEHNRIYVYRTSLLFVLAVLGVAIAVCVGVIIWQLNTMQVFDLLTLFAEDGQIIAEFWQDTLYMFWEYIPSEWFWGVILSLLCVSGILFITGKRRMVNRKKLSQLHKYTNN